MLGTARTLALVATLGLVGLVGAAQAQEARTITLTGTGEVSVIPDTATIQIGVESQADTATEALADNSAAAARVIGALKEAGVAPGDIRTANFAVQPVYSNAKSLSQDGPVVTGYRVTNQVIASIRDLDGLGVLLDRVIGEGANRIGGISFSVADETEALERARTLAIEDARNKARTYAEAAGVSLGPVLAITEAGAPPAPLGMAMMRVESAAVPIERGSTTIAAQVTVVWQIGG